MARCEGRRVWAIKMNALPMKVWRLGRERDRPWQSRLCVWVQQVRQVLWDQAIEGFVSGGRKTCSV